MENQSQVSDVIANKIITKVNELIKLNEKINELYSITGIQKNLVNSYVCIRISTKKFTNLQNTNYQPTQNKHLKI